MPWFKVDDGFAFHRKVISVGNMAVGLWVRAGSWSAHQLTDGHIPRDVVVALGGTMDDADRLVGVGLWDAVDDGFQFRGWHDFQPSKESVVEEREKARKRKQAWRDAKTNSGGPPDGPSGSPNGTDNGTPSGTDTVGSASPTRPDPTRPEVPKGTQNTGAKRATQLPADWKPNESHLEIAREYGLDPAYELRAFKDRNEAKGTTYKNWDAAFRTWLNQAKTFRGGQHSTPPSPATRRHLPVEVPDHIDPDDTEAYAKWAREAQQ